MREFKFRAFHKPEKKMYDVHGLEWSVDSLVFRERRKALIGEDQPCRWHTMYLIGKDGVTKVARGHEVIANDYELMQFTGRIDKHSNAIYEGDLIQRPGINIAMLVRWNEKNAMFDLTVRDPKDFDMTVIWYTHLSQTDYEIIGNIYENPELFGGGV